MLKTALAYAAPTLGLALLLGPLGLLPVIYAKYFGLALTSIATILLIGRMFDAITDPLIAHYSDQYQRRYGTRKPFILVGGIGMCITAYCLCVPIAEVSLLYFGFFYLVFYLFSTLYNIPMAAWAIEVTNDPKERTLLFSVLIFISKVGGLLFYIVPFLPIFASTEFTPETIKVSAIIGIAILVPTLLLALIKVPNGPALIHAEDTPAEPSFQKNLIEFYHSAKHNKPFLLYLGAMFFFAMGLGMFGGLFFLFVDSFLGQGDKFASLGIMGMIFSLAITPLCYQLAIRIGKRKTWMISCGVLLVGVFYSGLVDPGSASFTALLIIQGIFILSGSFSGVVSPAIYADILDYGSLRDTTDRKAMYVAITGFFIKAEVALAASLGLWLAGWFGFDATATEQTEQSTFAIRLAMSWVPLVIVSLSLFFIWLMPLNERRTAIVARRLNQRITMAASS